MASLNPQPEPPGMGRPDGTGCSRRGLLIGGLAVLVIAGLVVGLNLGHLLPGASSPSHIVSGGGVPTTTVAPTIPPTAVPTAPAAPTRQMVLRHNTTAVTVAADSRKTLHASCKAGEQMVGGGHWVNDLALFAQVEESYPSGLNEWTVTIFNQHGTQPIQMMAFADCLQTSVSLSMLIQSSSLTVPNGGGGSATALCPAGYAITGGGHQITLGSQGFVYFSDIQEHPAGWIVVMNAPAETTVLKVYALCAGAHLGSEQEFGKQFTVGAASAGT